MVILSWFENRPPDEIPPENLWEDPKGIEEFWDKVKTRKEYSKGREPGFDPKQIDEEVVSNDLASMLKQ